MARAFDLRTHDAARHECTAACAPAARRPSVQECVEGPLVLEFHAGGQQCAVIPMGYEHDGWPGIAVLPDHRRRTCLVRARAFSRLPLLIAESYGQRPIEAGGDTQHLAGILPQQAGGPVLHTSRSRTRWLPVLGLVLGGGLAAGLAMAQQSVWDTVPSMDVVRNRLSLTPEQESKLAPIFERRAAELRQVREQLEQATSSAQKRAILQDAKHGAKTFNSDVEG